MELCYVSLSKHVVIDFARADGRTQIFGQTLEETRQRYPDAQVMEFDKAVDAIESSMIDDHATEITEEQFFEALEALPPKRWQRFANSESFMMIEHFYGIVTSVYVRVDNRYYTFHDRCTLSHDDIIRKVALSQVKSQTAA